MGDVLRALRSEPVYRKREAVSAHVVTVEEHDNLVARVRELENLVLTLSERLRALTEGPR